MTTAWRWRPQGVLDWPRGSRLGKPTSVQAPHAFRHEGKYYCFYLFQQKEVFISDRPTHFGGEPLTHMTGIWYGGKWAPEVISTGGEDYLAGYGRGLWVARLKRVEMTSSQAKAHAGSILEKVRAGRAAEQRRRERERRKEPAD